MKTTRSITTRIDKNSDEFKTTLTIDWEGCTEDVLRQFATAALIVKLQSKFRTGKHVPPTYEVRAADMAPGTRTAKDPMTKLVELAMSDPAKKAELLKLLQLTEAEQEE